MTDAIELFQRNRPKACIILPLKACNERSAAAIHPFEDGNEHRPKSARFFGNPVLDTRRDLGIEGAVNQAIPFQLSQLDGQHVLCHARDRAPQGIEALRALAEDPKDLELPLSAEYGYRAPDVVIELGYVIIVWAPLGSMVWHT
jgi:hypothetical protein